MFSFFFLLQFLPTRFGSRTEGQSGGKGSAMDRSNRPRVTSRPHTIYQCYLGPTATHRRVSSFISGVFIYFLFLLILCFGLEVKEMLSAALIKPTFTI